MRAAPTRQRTIAGLALLLAAAVIVTVVLVTGASSAPGGGASAATSSGAATVQRRNLVESDTESGTLSYASPQTVYDRLSGTITWLPAVGQVIKPGGTLFAVDGQPVLLMDGTTPAYRDLGPSDRPGPDILELNRNLIALGFDPEPIVPDETWQAATTAGVETLQASLGETESGTLSLGQVVFLPGAQLVSTVEATLGSSGGAGSGGTGASGHPARASEFVALRTATKPAARGRRRRRASPAATLDALIALLRAEVAELRSARAPASGRPSSSGRSSPPTSAGGSDTAGSPAGSGDAAATASPILATTSTQLVVTVDLDASKQSEATVGEHVTVEMPSGNTVPGTITAVSPVAQAPASGASGNSSGAGSGGGSTSTIPVTIALAGHQSGAGLDQAAVSVDFVQAVANNVLSVPVTALLATAGGGYAVQEAAAPHRLLPVSTGLFAAGYVQISGPAIRSGLEVTDSQG